MAKRSLEDTREAVSIGLAGEHGIDGSSQQGQAQPSDKTPVFSVFGVVVGDAPGIDADRAAACEQARIVNNDALDTGQANHQPLFPLVARAPGELRLAVADHKDVIALAHGLADEMLVAPV